MKEHGPWRMLSAFLDGELEPGLRPSLQKHLKDCDFCRFELAALGRMKGALAASSRRPLPPDLLEDMESGFGPGAWSFWGASGARRVWAPAGAVAAVLLSLGTWLGWRVLSQRGAIPPEPLLAAHSRYKVEGLVPPGDMVASIFYSALAPESEF